MEERRLSEILSFSEIKAIRAIIDEVGDAEECIIQVTKLHPKYNIGKTVFVMALRLLDAADVVRVRSLGPKGTLLKILNREAIDKLLNN